MKVLITGATGLIGCEIGKRLAARGDEVVILVRPGSTGKPQALPFPATRFEWDHRGILPSEVLHGVEAVVHLAGAPIADGRWTDARKKEIRDSRIFSTRALVDSIQQSGSKVKVLVSASAVGFYGDRGDEILTTKSSKGTGFLSDVVQEWENEALRLTRDATAGRRAVVVRTGAVLARHGGALAKMLPLFRAQVAGSIGAGTQWMSWIHLEDIASLYLHAIDTPVEGVLDGSSPEPVMNKDFTRALCEEMGVIENLSVPKATLKVLYGEMSAVVLESQRVEPQTLVQSGFQFRFPTLKLAMRDLVGPLRNQTHEKFTEQWVPKAPEEVWMYFSRETNLEEITPPMLNFQVKAMSTPHIQEGTLIDYRLKLKGIPFGWQTRIEEWKPVQSFVDTQLKGPYSSWRHTHEFEPMAGGTLIRDRVFYRLPLGWLGSVAAGWIVESDVDEIFSYRRKKIEELFGA